MGLSPADASYPERNLENQLLDTSINISSLIGLHVSEEVL